MANPTPMPIEESRASRAHNSIIATRMPEPPTARTSASFDQRSTWARTSWRSSPTTVRRGWGCNGVD